jgi:L-rhamnose-H+ transport protein
MNLARGLILTLIAGVATGSSMVPLKWARRWRWENFWLLYTLVALWIAPAFLAYLVCPNLKAVYASLPFRAFTKPFVFGSLWGGAYLGAGVCTHRLGFAVHGALIGGVATAFGTLAPLIAQHSDMVFQLSGRLIVLGTLISLMGVGLCGWAGYRRERDNAEHGRRAGFSSQQTAMSQEKPTRKSYILMVLVAILSGLLAAFMNLALAYGGEISKGAEQAGAPPQWAPFAVWPVAFIGGSVMSFAYSFFLLSRNKTWMHFAGPKREILNPVVSACMWTGGVLLYSSATTYFGVLGVSIGFALFFIVLMICGQLMGALTGEWRQMQPKTYGTFALGIALLCVAVVTFGAAHYFST